MKIKLLPALLLAAGFCHAQSAVQTINSGSLVASASSVSIGEIVVNPASGQSGSGIIGILTQINAQTLETEHFAVSENVTVYPNPTAAKIIFNSAQNLSGQRVSVYDNSGKLVLETAVDADRSVNLETLASGIYLIRLSDQNLQSFKIIKH